MIGVLRDRSPQLYIYYRVLDFQMSQIGLSPRGMLVKVVWCFYFHVGALPRGKDPQGSAHHTPDFYLDESGCRTRANAMVITWWLSIWKWKSYSYKIYLAA